MGDGLCVYVFALLVCAAGARVCAYANMLECVHVHVRIATRHRRARDSHIHDERVVVPGKVPLMSISLVRVEVHDEKLLKRQMLAREANGKGDVGVEAKSTATV